MRKGFVAVFFVLFLFLFLWFFIPDPGLYPAKTWSKSYVSDSGKLLRLTLSDDDRYRLYLPLEKISDHLQKVSVFYEDRHFYIHPGFNPFSLARGFIDTFILKKRAVGGSTITMQTARIRFDIDSSSVYGKIVQILRAVQIERHYTKKKILEAYLNLVPYGGNIEGAGAAARIYFHKPASKLNLSEALALSVIPQNPSKRYPGNQKGEKELESARKRLINLWNKENKNEQIKRRNTLLLNFYKPGDLPYKAPHFVDLLEAEKNFSLQSTIETTLDEDLQNLIEKRVDSYIERKKRNGILNASVFLADYKSMEVKAMAGSAKYFNDRIEGQVNGCTAKRSPGSALKPFVYALGVDQGLIHSHTLLKDSPFSFSGFTPENYDKKFEGPLFAKDALIKSRNLPAVKLAAEIENPDLYDFLKKGGVTDLRKKSFYGLSLVLGGGEITMTELAKLYSVFGNYGILKKFKYIKNQNPVYEEKRLLSGDSCFIINSILAKNPPPGGKYYKRKKDIPVSWKTGTSYGFRDGWAAGIFGDYVLCVWVGNFNGEGNPAFTGRNGAGPLFFDIARLVKEYKKSMKSHINETKALNVKKVDVCSKSGNLPGKYTPKTVKAWFIPGVSPISVSSLHRPVLIDKKTGKRACSHDPESTRKEIFEFWPTDMKKLFEKGGIYIKSPPEYKDECLDRTFTDSGIHPLISSPSEGIKYVITSKDFKIPFKASAESGVKNIYWFADSVFEGKSVPGEVFLWNAKPGNFVIRASDDSGRTDSVKIEVVYEGE
ncbi:MAG: penicillin-binding protein 1C [Thermodesulfobacteriota bacterium]